VVAEKFPEIHHSLFLSCSLCWCCQTTKKDGKSRTSFWI